MLAPIGLLGPYSATSVSPATMVGSARGRSLAAGAWLRARLVTATGLAELAQELTEYAAIAVEKLLVDGRPTAEIVDSEQARRHRERAGELRSDVLQDRAVASLAPHALTIWA